MSKPILLLNKAVQDSIDRIVVEPPNVLLLIGDAGAGKDAIAAQMLVRLLGDAPPQSIFVDTPTSIWLGVETAPMIDDVRRVHGFISLKTFGDNIVRRAVVLRQVDQMSDEAQNAMLKMLEEPPADTLFLLLAENKTHIRPTVLSRARMIHITPVTIESALSYFSDIHPDTVRKMYMMTGGMPGLMSQLLLSDDPHPITSAMDTAKRLLSEQTYARLVMLESLSADKSQLALILRAIEQIYRHSLLQSLSRGDKTAATVWHRRLSTVHISLEMIGNNPNYKLLLTRLLMDL